MSKRIPSFLAENPALALFALLATASSAFGQTYYLGLFGDQLRTAFNLTHSSYGLIYAFATLCSAGMLLRFGNLVDLWTPARISILAVSILATGCLVLAGASHLVVLWLGFLMVRFGGQAMLSHIGMTTAGRYFTRNRGKVVAFAAAGYPLSEAVMPLFVTVLMIWIGWRATWVASSAALLLVILPLMLLLSRNAAHPQAKIAHDIPSMRGATRSDVLRDRGFYLLLPAALAGPFIVTALFFHQAAIARLKGWPTEAFATAFVAYGVGHLVSLLVAGITIDRITAQRTLPLALIPMLVGLLVLSAYDQVWTPWVFLGLLGLSQGAINAALGAIWPERYGIKHIGGIRSVMQAMMVVSTALSPVALGVLLDGEIPVGIIAFGLAIYTLIASLLAARSPQRNDENS